MVTISCFLGVRVARGSKSLTAYSSKHPVAASDPSRDHTASWGVMNRKHRFRQGTVKKLIRATSISVKHQYYYY